MTDKLRIALVGCGQIADGHAEEIEKIGSAELVAVCDREPILAEQLATRYGIESWFDDFEQLLSESRPDVVHICTPPASHLSLVRQAVASGAHVYVEKPLAVSHSEAVEMVRIVHEAGLKLTINHIHHFDPVAVRARRMIADGAIGEVVHVESWFGYNLNSSFGKLILGSPEHWVHALPGGILQNNINHLLHKMTEYITDPQPQVTAQAWRSGTAAEFGDVRDRLFDELRVTLRGQEVSGQGTFSSTPRPVGHAFRLYGTNGSLHLDYNTRMLVLDKGVVLPSAIGRLTAGWSQARRSSSSAFRNSWHFLRNRFHFFAGMNELMRRFYDSIQNDMPEPIPTDDILRITAIMDEIFSQIDDEATS